MSCSAGKSNFECWGVILPTNGVAVKLKELAEFLEYDNVKMAYKLIPEEWKMTWNEVQNTMVSNRDHLVTSSELPSNWHPETLFVLEPGVYVLARSNKPIANHRNAKRLLELS
ncbi:bro [Trichoplusia ni granulovirus LBIV-12]|uniref:Bro n=1 Tax=Trichoplusia ni granulovirus LBIV-12 TaxID=1916701 RepID=A0A1D8QLD6_GVTN|nr:bro [Trichoplusia ni granulovirus LBIV-12]AOW41463.1 bro [Trichoplusia ni granulovirus LBIV-12]